VECTGKEKEKEKERRARWGGGGGEEEDGQQHAPGLARFVVLAVAIIARRLGCIRLQLKPHLPVRSVQQRLRIFQMLAAKQC
jgi:hypothetical protein